MAKITEKNTKREILDVLRKTEAELAERIANSADPTESLRIKNDFDVVQNASEIADSMAGMFDFMNSASGKFLDMTSAIAIQEQKLQDLYEIEATALTLLALEDTYKVRESDLKESFESRRIEFKEALDKVKNSYDQYKVEIGIEREREMEAYQYDLKIAKRNNEENADLEIKKRFADVEYAETSVREREISAHDVLNDGRAMKEDAETKLAGIKSEIDKAVAVVANSMKSKHSAELDLFNAKKEGEVALLKGNIDSLENQLSTASNRIIELEKRLDSAYEQGADIARASVQGSSDKEMISGLMSRIGDNGKK